jgi:DNA-directed RNA polymerase alpha subunit
MFDISEIEGNNTFIKLHMKVFTDPRKILPLQVVNSLRRILLSDIETVAIDRVTFFKNESSLNNELLEHRISLVPVFTEDETIRLVLKVKCNPEEYGECIVYSDYILPEAPESESSSKPKISIGKDIVLAYLMPDKEIDALITLRKGTGKDNIRFSPVTIVTFKQLDTQEFEFFFEINEGYDIVKILREALRKLKESLGMRIEMKWKRKVPILQPKTSGTKVSAKARIKTRTLYPLN